MYHSGFHQRKGTNEISILRDLLQETGLNNLGGLIGKSGQVFRRGRLELSGTN